MLQEIEHEFPISLVVPGIHCVLLDIIVVFETEESSKNSKELCMHEICNKYLLNFLWHLIVNIHVSLRCKHDVLVTFPSVRKMVLNTFLDIVIKR